MSRLAEMKHKLRALGVADSVVDSLTKEEVDDAHDGPFVKAWCHKCDSEHRVSEGFVRRANLKTVDGFIMAKCGGCYL